MVESTNNTESNSPKPYMNKFHLNGAGQRREYFAIAPMVDVSD